MGAFFLLTISWRQYAMDNHFFAGDTRSIMTMTFSSQLAAQANIGHHATMAAI